MNIELPLSLSSTTTATATATATVTATSIFLLHVCWLLCLACSLNTSSFVAFSPCQEMVTRQNGARDPDTGIVAAAAKHCIGTIASPLVHVDRTWKKAKRIRLERTSGPRRRKHQQSVTAKVLQQVLTVFVVLTTCRSPHVGDSTVSRDVCAGMCLGCLERCACFQ